MRMQPSSLAATFGVALAALVLGLPASGASAREGEGRPGGSFHGRGPEHTAPSPHGHGRNDGPAARPAPHERGEPGWQRGTGPQRRDDDRGERRPIFFSPSGPERDGARPGPERSPGPGIYRPPASQTLRLPPPGHVVPRLPARPWPAWHGGDRYWFSEGIWYAPRPSGRGYVVVRPPVGIIVAELPVFRTVVRIGTVTLYLVHGVYYQPLVRGGYQVVAPPEGQLGSAPRLMIYPDRGQSPAQQARDEYECHGWAANRSGYDPTRGAPAWTQHGDEYRRAQAACLEGRGYTVR